MRRNLRRGLSGEPWADMAKWRLPRVNGYLRWPASLITTANAVAHSRTQGSSLTIGLIVGNICNSFFSTVVRAIESTVLRHGYKVIVCNTDESIEMELIHARALMEHRVDGIIVSPTANEKGEVSRAVKEIYGKQIHTVIFDRAVRPMHIRPR
jgi:LacI family transcriptional regulator